MKLQNLIICSLISAMAIVAQSEEMFGEYPYCTGCESNYRDSDGDWNYFDHHWCKVNEKKCQATDTCEPVAGYSCCENSSGKAYYFDFDGEWGVENNQWCFIKPLEKITDLKVETDCSVNTMPYVTPDGKWNNMRPANFIIYVNNTFLDEHEIKKVMLNDKKIDVTTIKYLTDGFRFSSEEFNRTTNDIKLIFRNKKTNQGYLLELIKVSLMIFN